ncbi:hypothetical protein J31TS4_18860 [Paenibacillus sp. J31TS4]|uniref:AAA family ATPase n=1 Tax=Paenibacillus sp. J31TS4 TaxID=2807195 RepID=UPI001B185346|nr:AAA family ATPase [Paenibacillus sp. J31TS4]GIP38606.1 hypothetical protein J31TS4_18860 [Paenibacillus sp. J31TS4]
MRVEFKSLKLHNYKSHRDLTVDFGELTQITGDNAKGKSSIVEAIPFTLYGTDALGTKTDPTPTNYEYDETRAELLLEVDGKQLLLGRAIVKGKMHYYINEIPKKSTEFEELVKSLFDKDLFLSLFNPTYFFSLHPTNEQRPLLLRYVSATSSKEVFKQMEAMQADKLAALIKKHSLQELQDKHKENKNKQDKVYIAAQSRTKTLQEQLDKLAVPAANQNIDNLKLDESRLRDQIKEADKLPLQAFEIEQKRSALLARIAGLRESISRSKANFPELRDEVIADTCRTCSQKLTDEAIAAVEADKAARIKKYMENHQSMVNQRKALEEELLTLEPIDVSEQTAKVRELEHELDSILVAIREQQQRDQLAGQIEQAKAAESETLASRNESIFILDAIKAFYAKEAELQAAKVQDLFTTLSLRLFKENKGDGEIKPDFEIMMDGKPYRKLSLSEGIRAGLELRDVLSQQADIVAPCFVDNAESITRFKQPAGQLIVCRVVANQDLKIETGE